MTHNSRTTKLEILSKNEKCLDVHAFSDTGFSVPP